MKYGDIVVYNNQIGTVVKSENDFKFHPCNRGCCSFSLLDTITDNDVREATNDEKLELIEKNLHGAMCFKFIALENIRL